MVTFILITTSLKADASALTPIVLQRMSYFWYLIQLSSKKNQIYKIKALLNYGSEINVMILVYIVKLRFITQKTSNKVQKIDALVLKTYSIVLARFLFQDDLEKV